MTYERFVSELRKRGYIPIRYSKSDTDTILNLTFDELRFDNLNKIETVLIAEDLYDVEITNEEMKSFIRLSDIIQCVSLKLSNDDIRRDFENLFEDQEFYIRSEKEAMWRGYKLALNDNKWKSMMVKPNTVECEKLDILVMLVEAYEAKYSPMDLPDLVETIKFEMEHNGLTVEDLEPMLGTSDRVYGILNYKRPLTLKMIWNLYEGLGIPAESLIKSLKGYR